MLQVSCSFSNHTGPSIQLNNLSFTQNVCVEHFPIYFGRFLGYGLNMFGWFLEGFWNMFGTCFGSFGGKFLGRFLAHVRGQAWKILGPILG